MGAKVQLVGSLAEKAKFSTTSAGYCIQGMVDKIGDIKSGSKVKEAMTAMAEATTLGFISLEVCLAKVLIAIYTPLKKCTF